MKIWKITCCKNCPSLSSFYDSKGQHIKCNMTKQLIKDIYKLPKWCSLPDYEEEDDAINIKRQTDNQKK